MIEQDAPWPPGRVPSVPSRFQENMKELTRLENPDPLILSQIKQVVVAADQKSGPPQECGRKILVVIRIILYRFDIDFPIREVGQDPDCRNSDLDFLVGAVEFLPETRIEQHPPELSQDRRG